MDLPFIFSPYVRLIHYCFFVFFLEVVIDSQKCTCFSNVYRKNVQPRDWFDHSDIFRHMNPQFLIYIKVFVCFFFVWIKLQIRLQCNKDLPSIIHIHMKRTIKFFSSLIPYWKEQHPWRFA